MIQKAGPGGAMVNATGFQMRRTLCKIPHDLKVVGSNPGKVNSA